MAKSLLDYAYDYVSNQKEPVAFADMWAYVVKEAGLDEETANKKVSQFYTNVLLDGRIVVLQNNTWDLKTRHKMEEVTIDISKYYDEIDTRDRDEEEDNDDLDLDDELNSDKDGDEFESEDSGDSDEEF